jgi:hypothetical protein
MGPFKMTAPEVGELSLETEEKEATDEKEYYEQLASKFEAEV